MTRRLLRILTGAALAVVLAVGCSSTPSTSPAAPAVEDRAPSEVEDKASTQADDLDAAVDALVDQLGPRQAFDAVLDALESGRTAQEIINDPATLLTE